MVRNGKKKKKIERNYTMNSNENYKNLVSSNLTRCVVNLEHSRGIIGSTLLPVKAVGHKIATRKLLASDNSIVIDSM